MANYLLVGNLRETKHSTTTTKNLKYTKMKPLKNEENTACFKIRKKEDTALGAEAMLLSLGCYALLLLS